MCILLQSRHEIGPPFFHGAIGRRGRLEQGVSVAGLGRCTCRNGRPMRMMEKIDRQIRGCEGGSGEEQTFPNSSGESRALVDTVLPPHGAK